jgi:hypothetical protein
MGPMLVNTKQKIAVLASGLVIATTGLVTDGPAAASADPEQHAGNAPSAVSPVTPSPKRT